MSLHQAIVLWMNHIPPIRINSFQDLSQPAHLNTLLHRVDPNFFPLNLSMFELVDSVNSYRENIDCQPIEYIDIGTIHQDAKQLEQLFQIVLEITLQSPLKGEIIKPILELEQNNQEILMHFLQRIFEKQDTVAPRRDENWLIDKIQELERQNLKLMNEVQQHQEESKDCKNQIKLMTQTIDQKDKQIKDLMEQIEKGFNFEQQSSQEDQLKMQILTQERKLTSLELQLQDYKEKDKLISQLKQENEYLKGQQNKMNKQKKQIELLQEKREQDKEGYCKIIEKNEQDMKQLKENLKKILNQLSKEKEKQLNNELQIQRQQAMIEKLESENRSIQESFDQKVKELENIIEVVRQESAEQEFNSQNSLDQDMLSRRFSYSKDNVELEYYRKEYHKLECQYKELKKEFDVLELDQQNEKKKKNLEMQILSQNQLSILHEQLKKQKNINAQQGRWGCIVSRLKQELEDEKKSQRRLEVADLEIQFLQQMTVQFQQIKLQSDSK